MTVKKEWSVRDLAELCGVSKPTIQNAIKELKIEFDKYKSNKQIFYGSKARKIAEFIVSDRDFEGVFIENDNDGIERQTVNDKDFIESPKVEKQSQNFEKQMEKLEKQLENIAKETQENAKNQQNYIEFLQTQIEAKDELIKSLSNKNDVLLSTNIEMAHKLSLIDRIPKFLLKMFIPKSEREPEPPKEEKENNQ